MIFNSFWTLIFTLLILLIPMLLLLHKKYKKAQLYKALKPYEKKCFQLMNVLNFKEFKEIFLKFNVNPDINDMNGVTLLMYSILKGLNFTQFLVENGANINLPDKSGQTPLLLACHYNTFETATYLLKQKNINIDAVAMKRRFYINPLLSCLYKKKYKLATELLKKGASIAKIRELLKMPDTLLAIDNETESFLKRWERWQNGRFQLLYIREQQKKMLQSDKQTKDYDNIIGAMPYNFFKIILEEYL